MQTQPLTWQAFIFQLILSLGPAVVALAATYITLRHQRKSKRDELSLSSTLRARELVFNHYQKKLDRISDVSDALNKSFGELHVLKDISQTADPGPAVARFINSFLSVVLMAKHEAEGVEDELKIFGLEKKYESDLVLIRQLTGGTGQLEGDPEQQFEAIRALLLSLTTLQEAVLEARMKELFSEYLPARRALKPGS